MPGPNDERIHEAVRAIYAAVGTPERYPDALRRVAGIVGVPLLTLDSYFHLPDRLVATGVRFDSDYDAQMVNGYLDYIAQHENPRLTWARGRRGFANVSDFEMFDQALLRSHPFFNELLRGFGLPCNVMTDVGTHARHAFTLAAHFDTRARATNNSTRRLLGHFCRHFAVAIGLTHQLATRGEHGSGTGGGMVVGEAYLDRSGRVQRVDGGFEQHLLRSEKMQLVDRAIACRDAAVQRDLQRAIGDALRHRAGDPHAAGAARILLSPELCLELGALVWAHDGPMGACLRIRAIQAIATPSLEGMLARRGCTRSEIALCTFVLEGSGRLADFALARHRSMNTIRSQLKSVFQKLGVNSQPQLHRVLHELAAPLRDLH